MKKLYLIVSAFVLLGLLASACSPQATPAADTAVPTAASNSSTAAVATGPANVMVGQSEQLGSFLVDAKGMTLYLFTKDTPNTSACYAKCATAWPPLLTSGAPSASDGVDASKLGTTTRTDGTTQVTYNGWPLYYYAKDAKPGDVTGQNVGSVWFVISPSGAEAGAASSAPASATATTAATGNSLSGAPALITVANNATLGSFLADAKGMTLYLYTKDSPNTSTCYGKCATAWPPLLTNGAPFAGPGADAGKLGTLTRTDGTVQVTYNGWPLYYYVKDAQPGDTTGQNVGSVWFVISPAGDQINK